jgi:hypothetical protein
MLRPLPLPPPARLFAALLALALGLSACSGARQGRPGVSPSRITIDDLSGSVVGMTAYDVVQRYRGQWLRKRGRVSVNHPQSIKVYLDTSPTPYGPVSSLREIVATDVEVIEHLNANKAQFRYGMDNTQGAIVVHLRTGPRRTDGASADTSDAPAPRDTTRANARPQGRRR